jgi:hypothetical protein
MYQLLKLDLGCAVCSLDLTTDINSWKEAVRLAVLEIRRLGIYGLTEGELARYKQAILAESAQAAAQAEQMSNEVLSFIDCTVHF